MFLHLFFSLLFDSHFSFISLILSIFHFVHLSFSFLHFPAATRFRFVALASDFIPPTSLSAISLFFWWVSKWSEVTVTMLRVEDETTLKV